MADTKTVSSKDDFHRERSRFLDAFAGLEEALHANPSAGKSETLAAQLQALRSVRNDLVHAQLRFVQLDGELQAIAVNSQHVKQAARPARVLFLRDFKTLNSQVGKVKAASTKAGCE